MVKEVLVEFVFRYAEEYANQELARGIVLPVEPTEFIVPYAEIPEELRPFVRARIVSRWPERGEITVHLCGYRINHRAIAVESDGYFLKLNQSANRDAIFELLRYAEFLRKDAQSRVDELRRASGVERDGSMAKIMDSDVTKRCRSWKPWWRRFL